MAAFGFMSITNEKIAKYRFHATTILLFHVLQKEIKCFIKSC
jgi:hypothetical protein